MTRLFTTLISCFLALWHFSGCLANDKIEVYEAAIVSLAEGKPAEETSAAIEFLREAGSDAFDVLLVHLDDLAPASKLHFTRAVMVIGEDGKAEVHTPTIGEACFDILHAQIEGNWPKGFRQYYVLNSAEIGNWLADRKDKSLKELQLECAQQSLQLAKQDHEKKPSYWTKKCVEFLENNLKKIQDS